MFGTQFGVPNSTRSVSVGEAWPGAVREANAGLVFSELLLQWLHLVKVDIENGKRAATTPPSPYQTNTNRNTNGNNNSI